MAALRTKTKTPIQASVDISLDELIKARVEEEERPYSYFVNKALMAYLGPVGTEMQSLEHA
jgi:hypothetical protein